VGANHACDSAKTISNITTAQRQYLVPYKLQVQQTMAPFSLDPPFAATTASPQPPSFGTAASSLPADLAAAAAAVSAAMGRLVEPPTPDRHQEAQRAAASAAPATAAGPDGAAAAPSPWAGSAAPEAAQAGSGFRLSLSELSASEETAATVMFEVRQLCVASAVLADCVRAVECNLTMARGLFALSNMPTAVLSTCNRKMHLHTYKLHICPSYHEVCVSCRHEALALMQGEPAAICSAESAAAMPTDAAIVAEGVLATVQRTLQHNTAFDRAPSEVHCFIMISPSV
jgi:hypothetical protein